MGSVLMQLIRLCIGNRCMKSRHYSDTGEAARITFLLVGDLVDRVRADHALNACPHLKPAIEQT